MKKNEAISILATSVRPREPKDKARYDKAVKIAIDALKESERKKGKWIPENRTMDAFWVCSACKFTSEAHAANILYNYCPNCGSRNIEEGEQDD